MTSRGTSFEVVAIPAKSYDVRGAGDSDPSVVRRRLVGGVVGVVGLLAAGGGVGAGLALLGVTALRVGCSGDGLVGLDGLVGVLEVRGLGDLASVVRCGHVVHVLRQ